MWSISFVPDKGRIGKQKTASPGLIQLELWYNQKYMRHWSPNKMGATVAQAVGICPVISGLPVQNPTPPVIMSLGKILHTVPCWWWSEDLVAPLSSILASVSVLHTQLWLQSSLASSVCDWLNSEKHFVVLWLKKRYASTEIIFIYVIFLYIYISNRMLSSHQAWLRKVPQAFASVRFLLPLHMLTKFWIFNNC